MSGRCGVLLISHQPASCVGKMVEAWRTLEDCAGVVVAYGGSREEFAKLNVPAVYVEDERLRTRDHQRELQSYSVLLQSALPLFDKIDCEWVALAEYDLVPLRENSLRCWVEEAEAQDADLLGVGTRRLDGTLHPHATATLAQDGWLEWVKSFSRREEAGVLLSCLGCAQLWRLEALRGVVAQGEPIAAYLEILLPTVAHHLGYRVRNFASHERVILHYEWVHEELDECERRAVSFLHPWKTFWN